MSLGTQLQMNNRNGRFIILCIGYPVTSHCEMCLLLLLEKNGIDGHISVIYFHELMTPYTYSI